jgi:tetratricopeptide (TPR) repeat protein
LSLFLLSRADSPELLRFKGARADFDEAIRLCPGDPGDYYERALVLKRQGQRAEAILILRCILIAIVPMAIATTTKSSTLKHCFAT